MDQAKIGNTLKKLRKEKGLTQEEIADMFFVTNRSVSRWETGSNLPDIATLIELADFYDVDIRLIIDGEIESKEMKDEIKDTALKVSEYEAEDQRKFAKRLRALFTVGIIGMVLSLTMEFSGLRGKPISEMIFGWGLGFGLGMLIVGLLYVTGRLSKIKKLKNKLLKKYSV